MGGEQAEAEASGDEQAEAEAQAEGGGEAEAEAEASGEADVCDGSEWGHVVGDFASDWVFGGDDQVVQRVAE